MHPTITAMPRSRAAAAYRVEMARLDLHGLVEVVRVQRLLQRRVEPRAVRPSIQNGYPGTSASPNATSFAPSSAALLDEADHLLDGGRAVEPDRRDLRAGNAQGSGGHARYRRSGTSTLRSSGPTRTTRKRLRLHLSARIEHHAVVAGLHGPRGAEPAESAATTTATATAGTSSARRRLCRPGQQSRLVRGAATASPVPCAPRRAAS